MLTTYTNPFNLSTAITVNLEMASNVNIGIFSVNGRLVTEVANRILSLGTHTLV